jgi:DNA polymerase I-like protein with 3'-5' exonuclease and polymerase domains
LRYTIWDVETTIRTSFKRKANPFDPENFVVMSGWQRKGGLPVGEYFGRKGAPDGPGLPQNWFSKLLEDTDLLVGINIKFDLLHALRDPANHAAWMEYVARGGNVWCCQLAEYLLEGMDQANQMLSMDELAPRYGGNLKFDEVKVLWNAGVCTTDIDPNLLRTYLCGNRRWVEAEPGTVFDAAGTKGRWEGEHGDIGNTEVIFLGQVERAKAAGQSKSILMNMGSLLCTTEMERNGMAVDKALGLKQAEELAERLAVLSVELAGYLPADLPFDFNWNSGPQKSALIFGGTVTYKKWLPHLTPQGEMQYAMKDEVHVLLSDGGTCELDQYATWLEAFDIGTEGATEPPPPVRYSSGKNAGELKTKKVKVPNLDKPKGAIQDVPYTFPRITEPSDIWKGKVEGVWSTSSEVIEALGNRNIPFLKSLSKVSALTKDLGTYYITIDPKTGEPKGMLTLVQADGIIHHMLNHCSTVTARFSSSNPNLQNIPKDGKSLVKSIFVSRFGKDGKIIQSDFKSLEVYIQAILTHCLQLISDLQEGLDMHCVRVGQTFDIPYEEAVDLCKVQKLPEWDARRTDAKVFSFQRAYGAGTNTIHLNTGIAVDVIEALIQAENVRYPEIEPFFNWLTDEIKASSRPTHIKYNHPGIPGLECNPREGTWRTPDGKLYKWREGAAPEWLAKRKGERPTSFSPTEIKNYPVQGTGGEWAKAAMWLAIRVYYKMKNWGGRALLANQVHDALYTDAHNDVAIEAAAALHAAMEEASTFMEWYFNWTIPVPVPTDTEYGPNMMEHTHMPEGFKERVKVWRASIRKHYINDYQPSFEQALPLAA